MLLEKLEQLVQFKRRKKPPSPYADYNTRMIASVIDVMCLLMLFQLFAPELLLRRDPGSVLFCILSFALLMTLIQDTLRTTPGKWLMGIKLVRRDEVSEVGFLRLLLRYVLCLFSCAAALLGLLWIMVDKKRRAWHDIASGTVVLNMRPEGWYFDKLKQGWQWLRGKCSPPATHEAVAQPPADEGNERREDTV